MNLYLLLVELAVATTFAMPRAHTISQPILQSTNYIGGWVHRKDADLKDVLAQGLDGWEFDTPAVQNSFLNAAEKYISYRRGRGDRAANDFIETCTKKPESNVFCDLEIERLVQRSASRDSRNSGRGRKASVAAWIRQADLNRLAELDQAELTRGLGLIDEMHVLAPLVKKVSSDRHCQAPRVATALGFKLEEFFPDPQVMNQVLQLYNQASQCGFPKADVVEAGLRSSLLSIWRGDCAVAETKLARIAQMSEAEKHMVRIRYWRHYCAVALKHKDVAEQMAKELIARHPLSFQNMLVNGERLRDQVLAKEPSSPRVLFRSVLNPDLNSYARAIEALFHQKANDLAAEAIEVFGPQIENGESGFRLYMAALATRVESGLSRFKVLATLFRDQPRATSMSTLRLYFPLAHFDMIDDERIPVEPLLVTALIRQESAFNSRAQSAAGARGLMQVMPATARSFGSRSRSQLFDPKVNIRVGSNFFAHYLRTYNGDVELTLAAYNAGFSRVDNWLKRYPVENRMLFLDLIPFKETRDYVSAIIRNYYWYVQIYSKEPLKARLERPGKVPIKVVSMEK